MTTPKTISPGEMHRQMMLAFKKRLDMGFKRAAANLLLEPPNPFQPELKRRLSRGFILALLVAVIMAGGFVYFNYVVLKF